jgi:hypothetical protein
MTPPHAIVGGIYYHRTKPDERAEVVRRAPGAVVAWIKGKQRTIKNEEWQRMFYLWKRPE